MYEKCDPEDRLDETDAIFVDVIHTNAGQYGFDRSIGHMDFYPNGGKNQPDCDSKRNKKCDCLEYYSIAKRKKYLS